MTNSPLEIFARDLLTAKNKPMRADYRRAFREWRKGLSERDKQIAPDKPCDDRQTISRRGDTILNDVSVHGWIEAPAAEDAPDRREELETVAGDVLQLVLRFIGEARTARAMTVRAHAVVNVLDRGQLSTQLGQPLFARELGVTRQAVGKTAAAFRRELEFVRRQQEASDD